VRVRELGDYLDLTPDQAAAQWRQILRRVPRDRQEKFTPVEVVLCYALFFVVDPHRYGGASMHRAPAIVHALANLFVRSPGSINIKMMNLDASRKNAGKHEWRFFVEMATSPNLFPVLYDVVLVAAREVGVDATRLPNFLHIDRVRHFDLLGQNELSGSTFDAVVARKAAKKRLQLLSSSEAETVRLVEQAVRLGQHRFAAQVLDDYSHSCAFCGFAPKSIPGNRLLVAFHIKPWADSDDLERLDPHNGVAACHSHDAAFDSGLITVNGGLRVHRSPILKRSAADDAKVDAYFGDALAPRLLVPDGVDGPGQPYLEWHHNHIYQGQLAS